MHLLRGAAALALIFAAFFFRSYDWAWSVLALVGAVVLLRGCPMFWLMGLFETIARRHKLSTEQSIATRLR